MKFVYRERHRRKGGSRRHKKILKNVFGQKIDAIRAKINHANIFVHDVFFWMIILIIPEMNIIDVSSLI